MKEQSEKLLGQVEFKLAKNLQYFRERGYSMRQSLRLVSGVMVDHEIRKFHGNQSRAADSLGLSRGTFRQILDRVEKESCKKIG